MNKRRLGRGLDALLGREEGGYEPSSFDTGDLLRMPIGADRYDVILCRNTVIYFTEPVRDALHARLAAALRPGGYLLVGSTERITTPATVGLEPVHPFTYRKR